MSAILFILLSFSRAHTHTYVTSSKRHHPNEMFTPRIVGTITYNILTWVYLCVTLLMPYDSSYSFFSLAFRKDPQNFYTLTTTPTSSCACVWRKYWLFRFFSEIKWRAEEKIFSFKCSHFASMRHCRVYQIAWYSCNTKSRYFWLFQVYEWCMVFAAVVVSIVIVTFTVSTMAQYILWFGKLSPAQVNFLAVNLTIFPAS